MADGVRQRFDLSGKVAIVTGASKGIGESMAQALAEMGASVVVSSRKQEAVDEVAGRFKEAGWEATGIAAHTGDVEQIQALVDGTIAAYGGVDIIVNNAATNPVFGPLLHAEGGVFDKIMHVNVRGPLELAKRAFPSMESRGGGSVINIASVGGVHPEPMLGLYSVSKAALISLTKVMAAEWGPANVRANAVCPGLIKTKFSEALWNNDDILNRFMEKLPLKYVAGPEELGPLAVFLASDASAYCTGAVFTVDGGVTI